MLDALRDLIADGGDQGRPQAPFDLPDGVLAAPRHAWRNRFLLDVQQREPDAKRGTHDRIFRRAVADLTKGEKVGEIDEWFWPKSGQSPDMSGQ